MLDALDEAEGDVVVALAQPQVESVVGEDEEAVDGGASVDDGLATEQREGDAHLRVGGGQLVHLDVLDVADGIGLVGCVHFLLDENMRSCR